MVEIDAKELMNELADALESGAYKQRHGCLCSIDAFGLRYCCLGVLGDILTKHGIVEWEDETDCDGDSTGYRLLISPSHDEMKFNIVPLASIVTGLTMGDQSRLIQANDNCGWDFRRIAEAIRQYDVPGSVAAYIDSVTCK